MLNTLLGLNTEELRALVQEDGEPEYRGSQLAEQIYRRGAHTFEDMTNLPDQLRSQLSKEYEVGRSQTLTAQHSRDGTIKLLLAMRDGAKVETVGLPYADRFSCCLSTQVGCPVACVFCATGLSGYTRNLTVGEIVDQVLAVQEAVDAAEAGADIIMLDNMDPDEMRHTVGLTPSQVMTEASGGITLANVRRVAMSGVNTISVGALTHSAKALDISLELEPQSLKLIQAFRRQPNNFRSFYSQEAG